MAVLRAVIARTAGATAMAPGLRPGVDGRRSSIDLGLFEGAHASPRYFVLITDTLIARLRELKDGAGQPVGVRVGGERRGVGGRAGTPSGDGPDAGNIAVGLYVGSLGFMDDVAALIEEIEHAPLVLKETRRWARWARSLLADEKTTVTATRLGDDDLPAVPRYVAGAATTRAATWLWVRTRSDAAAGFHAHGVARAAVAHEYVKQLKQRGVSELGVLTVGQQLEMWMAHIRAAIEDVAPLPKPAAEGRAAANERLQRHALTALLGSSTTGGGQQLAAYAPLLVVFGVPRVAERVLQRRLGFVFSLEVSRRRPERRALVD